MSKGYVIITEHIHDAEAMRAYERASAGPLVAFGGKVLAVDHDVHVLEGAWHGTRTVVVQFETVEQAHAWYESADYQAALPLRQAAAICNAVIVNGFPRPSVR